MQTFLPYPDFVESAKALDYRRLGKQRVEGLQILNALAGKSGWSNHPATRMWKGFEDSLKLYTNTMIKEWIARGYINTMEFYDYDEASSLPDWIGDERVHKSHRVNLLRKNFEFYSPLFKDEANSMTRSDIESFEYYWPV